MECFSPGLPHNPMSAHIAVQTFFGTTACKWEQTGLPPNAMSAHIAIQTFLGQPPVNQDIFLLHPHFCSFPFLKSNICRLRLYMLELGVKNLLRALNKPEVQYYWSQLLRYPCWMNDAKVWQDSPVKEPIRQRERRQQWVVTQPHSPQHTHEIGGFSRKESIPAGKKHDACFCH